VLVCSPIVRAVRVGLALDSTNPSSVAISSVPRSVSHAITGPTVCSMNAPYLALFGTGPTVCSMNAPRSSRPVPNSAR